MKKHVHEALIKEWLDTGMPHVEYRMNSRDSWGLCSDNPCWIENGEYRLVYPPKPKRQIKMLCYYDTVTEKLLWSSPNFTSGNWIRVSAEDKEIEIDD